MKHLRNPTTGEVRLVTPLMAKRMRRYGWQDVTQREWVEYKRAQIQLGIVKHVSQARASLH